MNNFKALCRSFFNMYIIYSYVIFRITRGGENVLFHYVQLHDLEGVYVTPSDYELASVQGAIHSQLLDNFYRCSLHIRKLFTEQKQVQVGAPVHSHRMGTEGVVERVEGVAFIFYIAFPSVTLCNYILGRIQQILIFGFLFANVFFIV